MSSTIRLRNGSCRKGISAIEVLLATFVALYVILGAWSVYIMAWRWWNEVQPKVEAQRIARLALSGIIYGSLDSTAGTYTVGGVQFTRRNGISGAVSSPNIPSDSRIDFQLEGDTGNDRAFYLGADAGTGLGVVYYTDDASQSHELMHTEGITDLKFEKYMGNNNVIKVTATVERTISGTRSAPYNVKAEYSEVVYLRNVQ